MHHARHCSGLKRKRHQNLPLGLIWIHSCTFALLILATLSIIYTVQRSLLIKQGQDSAEQLCLRVISDFDSLILQTQNQTHVLADLASVMKPDTQQYKKSFRQILIPKQMQNVVAGGGLWPEPYAFDPKVQRRSFFWGMQPNGTLKFYDQYNDPNGPGYHNEPWYIPARYYPSSASIWSQSYTDPYSKQPMVTCSVPYYKQGVFQGVCTLDLKLEGLNRTLQSAMQSTGGYIFIVDRDGRFIAFPQMNRVREQKTNSRGETYTQYLLLTEAAKRLPGIDRIGQLHDEMNIRMVQNAQRQMINFTNQVAALQQKHPTLANKQAQLIIACMFDQTQMPKTNPRRIRRMTLSRMPLINEPCAVSVFRMPRTYWSVIMVTPASRFTQPADQASVKLALWLVGIELLAYISIIILARKWVIHSNPHNLANTAIQWQTVQNQQLQTGLGSLKTAMDQIREMTATHKQRSGKTREPPLITTDIRKLITDILHIDHQDMKDHNIQCQVQIAFDDLLLLDTYRLGQALTNILGNARRALQEVAPEHRHLKICAQLLKQKMLQITITDTGSGIAAEHLPHIFEHGYSSKPHARGVGLHSALQAIKELGGVIHACSEGPGKGASITLKIPVRVQYVHPIDNL